MTETTTQTEAPAAPAAPKARAIRINLVSASGLKKLKIEAHPPTPRREGWKFYVEQEVRTKPKGKATRTRGAFATFPDKDAAKAHADSVAETARAQGWKPITRQGGFAPKPSSFDAQHLPKP
jgi:hypothetical protein